MIVELITLIIENIVFMAKFVFHAFWISITILILVTIFALIFKGTIIIWSFII
jgi:hypothetical protein